MTRQWPAGASTATRPGRPIYSCRHVIASTSPCTRCQQTTQTPAGGTR